MAYALVTAGLVVEGFINEALRGKHYRKGVTCILHWNQALIQIRLRDILQYEELLYDIKNNLDTLRIALIKLLKLFRMLTITLRRIRR